MSVHFISGKPGGGKSLYAVRLLVAELVRGTRSVVTNLPLRLPELNEYIQREHPEASVALLERVQVLDDEEASEFWLHRGPGRPGPVASGEGKERKLDFSGVSGGVLYVVDELHNFFNARRWMSTGPDALFYLSQHRKLGDDVVCITQAVQNVDKQFRSLAQDFTYVRNHSKERMMGFRSLGLFTRRTYLEPFTGVQGQQATEFGTFRLDVRGLASCYGTSAGVGIQGRLEADRGKRLRGPSVLWLGVGFVGLLVGLYYGPELLIKGMLGGSPAVPSASASVSMPVVSVTNFVGEVKSEQRLQGSGTAVARSAEVSVGSSASRSEVEEVWMVGKALLPGGRVQVMLSDGRTLTERNSSLQAVGPDHVLVNGRVVTWAPLEVRRRLSGLGDRPVQAWVTVGRPLRE